MKIPLSGSLESSLESAFPGAFRIVAGFSGATVLDDREGWQEVRFSREMSEAIRRGIPDGLYTVQIVRRGKGPRRTGKGRYPACE